jgi:hypothetical protein
MSLGEKDRLWITDIPKSYVGRTFKELSGYFREKQAIIIGVMRDKQDVKLEDLLSDNTSIIDSFIREKLKEAKKSFYVEKNDTNSVINPDDNYKILSEDNAVVLSKTKPK